MKTAAERVLDRIELVDGCWVFQGAKDKDGYGMVNTRRRAAGVNRTERAHRVVYESVFGPVPDGLVLDHSCNNTPCVNPVHLAPVDDGENSRRGYARQRALGLGRYAPQGGASTGVGASPGGLS